MIAFLEWLSSMAASLLYSSDIDLELGLEILKRSLVTTLYCVIIHGTFLVWDNVVVAVVNIFAFFCNNKIAPLSHCIVVDNIKLQQAIISI